MKQSKKELVRERFLKRLSEGKPIVYKELKKDDSSLLWAIERHFGSLSKICEDVGISQKEMVEKYGFSNNINKRTLSEEEMLERLLYLKSKGKLTTNAMRKEFDDLRLEQSLKKVYGSVNEVLKHFNLENDRKNVTKESLIKQINYYKDNNTDLKYTNMIEVDSALVSNANKKFGKGWHEILKDLNIEFVADRKSYSRDSIKKRLDIIFKKYGEVNYSLIKSCDSSILFYANDKYDNLYSFYSDMGYNPEDCMDLGTQKIKGKDFELVFKEILEALNVNFKFNKYYNKKVRPDFQLDNNIWIDCKLSSWTSSTKRTVNKYCEYCDKLIIVYLRGKKRKLYEYENYNVEFRKVDYYYKQLEEIGRQDLILKCQAILNLEKLNEINCIHP